MLSLVEVMIGDGMMVGRRGGGGRRVSIVVGVVTFPIYYIVDRSLWQETYVVQNPIFPPHLRQPYR